MNELDSLLTRPSTTLDEVLMNDSAIYLYQIEYPLLRQYILNHCDQLLHSALFSNDPIMQKRASQILNFVNPVLFDTLIEHDAITCIAESILSQECPNTVLISRLCNVIELGLQDNYSQLLDSLWYLGLFIRYINLPAISHLFESSITDKETGQYFITYLLYTDFDIHLIEMLDSLLANEIEFSSEFVVNLYNIIIKLITNISKMLARFSTPIRLSKLIKRFDQMPQFVYDAHLELLLHLCNEENIPFIADYINKEFPTEFDIKKREHLLFLEIAHKTLQLGMLKPENNVRILMESINIFNNWPAHSIALGIASQIVITFASNFNYVDQVLQLFIPIAHKHIKDEIVTRRAFIFQVIEKLQHLMNNASVRYLYQKYVHPKALVRNSDYGFAD